MANLVEDADLIKRFITTRDPILREEVILRYVPLVYFVVGRLGLARSMGQDYEDAVSQGLMGLVEAIDRYDAKYGTQFSTYATVRIRGRILDHLRSLDWLSRSARRRTRLVQDAANELWNSLRRAPTDSELAQHLGLDLDALQQALVDASQVIFSLDTMVEADGDDEASLHEVLADNSQPNPADAFDEKDLKDRLLDVLKSLSEREQLVLSLYYYEELTLKEIGAVLDVSESRVCQLHARAIMTMRSALNQAVVQPPIQPTQALKGHARRSMV
jgi:RNA polymerase sigma factor FliA